MEPYEGDQLDRQLDEAAAQFINDPDKNRLDGTYLYLSKVFKWYAEDFKGGVIPFVLKYARNDLKGAIEEKGDQIKIRYLGYDWSLNACQAK